MKKLIAVLVVALVVTGLLVASVGIASAEPPDGKPTPAAKGPKIEQVHPQGGPPEAENAAAGDKRHAWFGQVSGWSGGSDTTFVLTTKQGSTVNVTLATDKKCHFPGGPWSSAACSNIANDSWVSVKGSGTPDGPPPHN